MKVEWFKEYSHNLGRDMEFKVFGHAGKPCIAFPVQDGRYYDYENRGIIESMREFIDAGRIQVFCVDSIDIESWSADWKWARDRMEAQEAYYRYIIEEIVPRVYEINTWGNGGGVASGIMVYGCSMGAYHAMNFFLRRPDIFDAVLALSGIYHSGFFVKNYADDLTFLNSPIDSLKNMSYDHPYLPLYRRARIIVAVGQGDWEWECLDDTRSLEWELRKFGVDAWFDYWGYEYAHDWPSWLKQTPHFLRHILD